MKAIKIESKKKRLPNIKPIPRRSSKSTAAEVELRVQAVVKLVLQGYSRADIVRYAKQTWAIESRMVDVYLVKAKVGIKEIAAGEKEELTDKAVARFEELYSKAYKNQDWGLCKGIQESINKLIGLNADSGLKIAVTTGSISPEKWLSDNAE